MTEEYPITTHPDGKQFIRLEDQWLPMDNVVEVFMMVKGFHLWAEKKTMEKSLWQRTVGYFKGDNLT